MFAITLFSQQANVEAVLDTSNLRIGEQAKIDLYLNYTADKNLKVEWPALGDTITEKIEVLSVSPIDTTFPDKSNPQHILQHQQITVSVYDSGYYVVPGFKFILNGDTAHPLFTKPLYLEVHTVPTDTSAAKIKDIKPPFEEPFNWKWYIEYLYWGIAILVLVLITIIVTTYFARKNKKDVGGPPKPKIPAHITALAALEKIKEDSIWREGKVKEYYSAISDAVRFYIEERFNLPALESTTDEIMTAFRTQVVDKDSKEKLQQLLKLSDLVKFAKQFPIDVEHTFTLQNAFDFVNGTKRSEEIYTEVTEEAYAPSVEQTAAEAKQQQHPLNPVPPPVNRGETVITTSANGMPAGLETARSKSGNKARAILLIAISVTALLIIALLVYFFVTRLPGSQAAAATANNGTFAQVASEINRNKPIMIDTETRLDSATALDNKILHCYCTLVNEPPTQLTIEDFKNHIKTNILNLIKSGSQFKSLREQSGTFKYECRDKWGRELFDIIVEPADYLN